MRTEPIERGWGNVPARDPDFAGREEQLAAVRAGLLAGRRSWSTRCGDGRRREEPGRD
jgi:hypothetical protein